MYNHLCIEYQQCYLKVTVKDLREFISQNCYKQTEFTKEDSYYLLEKKQKRFSNTSSKIVKKY